MSICFLVLISKCSYHVRSIFFLLKYVLDVFIVMIYFLKLKNLLVITSFSKSKNLFVSSLDANLNFFNQKQISIFLRYKSEIFNQKLICIFLRCRSEIFQIKNRFISFLDTNLNFSKPKIDLYLP